MTVESLAGLIGVSANTPPRKLLWNEVYFARRDGDRKKHDRDVCAAASKLAQDCDVIVLAQTSMEHLASEISEMTSVPVLSSPEICVESLAELLTN